MFDRLVSLIGEEKFNKIQSKNVLVIGLGGVGGYVVESLVRSGIKNITIIDGDKIDETNLNRQLIALHSTIGKKKTEVFENRIRDINPEVVIEVKDKFLDVSDVTLLNLEKYDFIVDCIDDVPVKVALAREAVIKSKKIIMATGTARKLKPEYLEITTLNKTSYDPLAKILRRELKDISSKISVVASTEIPCDNSGEALGSSVFVPASAGIMIASYIINVILGE